MAKRTRCDECGKVKPKDGMCLVCWKIKKAKLNAEASAIVERGNCPLCGLPLVRNLALVGWWQCAALGNEDNKRRNGCPPGTPDCSYQCFTQ